MSRANQWFVPGDGIAREVITADIQRYLGPDALVRPGQGSGDFEGRPGYWITAYRTLTSQMIQDLKMDSQRWQQERVPGEPRGVSYQDSRTHAARQHWGPTETRDGGSQIGGGYSQPQTSNQLPSQTSRPSYSSHQETSHYTTAPTSQYGPSGSHLAYQGNQGNHLPNHSLPRSTPTDSYANSYNQPSGGRGDRDHQNYGNQAPYSYNNKSTSDSYTQQPVSTTSHSSYPAHAPSSASAQPGYYIASDGRQYPIQPAQQQPTRRWN